MRLNWILQILRIFAMQKYFVLLDGELTAYRSLLIGNHSNCLGLRPSDRCGEKSALRPIV